METKRGKFVLPEYMKVLRAAHQEARSSQATQAVGSVAIAFQAFCTHHLSEDGFQFIPHFALTDQEILNAYNAATGKNTVRTVRIPLHSVPPIVLHGFQSEAEDATVINPFGKFPWSDPRNKEAQARRIIINQSGLGAHTAFEAVLETSFSTPLRHALTKVLNVPGLVNRIVTVTSDLMYLAFAHALEQRTGQAAHFLPLIQLCTKGAIPIGDRQDGDGRFSCDILCA